MNRYDYVIFDFDGTVADTGEGILNSLRYTLLKLRGESPKKEDLRFFVGPPIYQGFVSNLGVSEDEVQLYIKTYRQRYISTGVFECSLYDGIEELFSLLHKNGVLLGIASSKPQKLIYEVIKILGISDVFDAIVGTDGDGSKESTKSQLILTCMQKLGADDKSRVLMVGDRKFDLDGAKGAGVDSCAVCYGYGSVEEFVRHEADYIVKEALEIADIVLPDSMKG